MTYEIEGSDSIDVDGATISEPDEGERTDYGPDSYVVEYEDGSSYTYERQEFGEGSETTTEIEENPDGSYTAEYEKSEGGSAEHTTVTYDGSDTYDIDSETISEHTEVSGDIASDIIGRDD